MLGRHGRAYVALGGLIALALLFSEADAQQRQHEQRKPSATAAQSNPTTPTPALQHLKQPPAATKRDERGRQGQNDGFSQEVANWSDFAQAVAAFIGLILVGFTIFYSHKAWREAQTSAGAAVNSANAMIAAERAYVFFQDTVEIDGSGYPAYEIIWKNYGKTPAIVTMVRRGIEWGEEPSVTEISKYEMPIGAIIGAGDSWPRGRISMKDVIQTAAAHPDEPVLAWLRAEISYLDIHNRPHRTWFCRFWNGQQFLLSSGIDESLNGYD